MPVKPITVVLVDDQLALRELLAARLASEKDFNILQQAGDAAEGVRLTEKLSPDLLVINSIIGGRVIFDTIARLHRSVPHCGIVLLASLWTDGHLRRAMEIRIRGYLLKTEPTYRLIGGMRAVASGDHVFSQPISNRLATIRAARGASAGVTIRKPQKQYDSRLSAQRVETTGENRDDVQAVIVADGSDKPRGVATTGNDTLEPPHAFEPPRLSTRECEVLTHLAIGHSRREIAKRMHISENTVANHTAKVMAKLDIHDRVALTRYAIREGLVQP